MSEQTIQSPAAAELETVALPASAPRVRITAGAGSASQKTWNLRRPVAMIGSRRTALLYLEYPEISKAHCLIVNTGSEVLLRDLASRTGTFCDEQKVDLVVLHDGSVLRVGLVRIQVAIQSAVGGADDTETGYEYVDPLRMPGRLGLMEPNDQHRHELPRSVNVIGRRDSCDLVLSDEEVSLAHAVIFHVQGRPAVYDLGSRSGTFLNGQPVTLAYLRPGDQLRFGQQEFVVDIEQAAVGGQLDLPPTGPQEARDAELVGSAAPPSDSSQPPPDQTISGSGGDGAVSASDRTRQARQPAGDGLEGEVEPRPGEVFADLHDKILCLHQDILGWWDQLTGWQQRLEQRAEQLHRQLEELAQQRQELEAREQALQEGHSALEAGQAELANLQARIEPQRRELEEARQQLQQAEAALAARGDELASQEQQIQQRQEALARGEATLQSRDESLQARQAELARQSQELTDRETELARREQALAERARQVEQRQQEISVQAEAMGRLRSALEQASRSFQESLQRRMAAISSLAEVPEEPAGQTPTPAAWPNQADALDSSRQNHPSAADEQAGPAVAEPTQSDQTDASQRWSERGAETAARPDASADRQDGRVGSGGTQSGQPDGAGRSISLDLDAETAEKLRTLRRLTNGQKSDEELLAQIQAEQGAGDGPDQPRKKRRWWLSR